MIVSSSAYSRRLEYPNPKSVILQFAQTVIQTNQFITIKNYVMMRTQYQTPFSIDINPVCVYKLSWIEGIAFKKPQRN
jgi:hypothetical protein